MSIRILFFFLLLSLNVFSQSLFQDLSFSKALQQAKSDSKLVFIQFEAATCQTCNETADKAFSDPSLIQRLNEIFICLKITKHHPDRIELEKRYNLVNRFGSLFIGQDGALIHRIGLTSSNPQFYQQEIESVLVKAGENISLNEMEKEYSNGNRSIAFIEALLQKRKTVGMQTDQLLDDYVNMIPHDSLSSVRTIQFIGQMAPMLDSKAYQVITADSALFNLSLRTMKPALLSSIGNLMRTKTLDKAIREKNESLALLAGSFGLTKLSRSPINIKMSQDRVMLQYYLKTNDTAQYIKKAIAYFEGRLMAVNPDTVKRHDSLNYSRLKNSPVTSADSEIIGYKATISSITPFVPAAQSFMMELNNAAWNFYKMTENTYLLSLATDWAKRALEFNTAPAPLDTYARLLYKQGQKEKAIELEIQAIELMKQRKFTANSYEKVLEQMKLNAAKIN